MNDRIIFQILLSFLLGGIIFYISAPHSWGLGMFYQELIYGLSSIAASFLIVSILSLMLHKNKKKHFFLSLFFCTLGVVIVGIINPANQRYAEPSAALYETVQIELLEAGMPDDLKFTIKSRRKVPFDFFSEHSWPVLIHGHKAGKLKYGTYIEQYGNGYLVTYENFD
ncbi:hypothetical protein [Kangiella koreensis]|nr:hypothetical protein [Kangiella koreensis]